MGISPGSTSARHTHHDCRSSHTNDRASDRSNSLPKIKGNLSRNYLLMGIREPAHGVAASQLPAGSDYARSAQAFDDQENAGQENTDLPKQRASAGPWRGVSDSHTQWHALAHQ
jgi:hypothetical protein